MILEVRQMQLGPWPVVVSAMEAGFQAALQVIGSRLSNRVNPRCSLRVCLWWFTPLRRVSCSSCGC